MLLSIVVPCYNEDAVLREFHRRAVAVLEQSVGTSFELIYTDDGSHKRLGFNDEALSKEIPTSNVRK